MSEEQQDSTEVNTINTEQFTSVGSFKTNYEKILVELDALAKGVYDETEAAQTACLLYTSPSPRD